MRNILREEQKEMIVAQDVGNNLSTATESWLLPSADGWNKLKGTPIYKWISLQSEALILMEISITGESWQRDKNDINEAEITKDFISILPQVVTKESSLKKLVAELDRWLFSPLDISIELSGVDCQSFQIAFGVNDGFICKPEKPVCTIRYAGGRMKIGEWNYVVDQSCIRLFRDGLNQILWDGS